MSDSWHWMLELKLRTLQGNAFQDFMADLMQARYGDDFVRVKPYGSLGDKGCDGYRITDGAVFACYGAQNGATANVSQLVKKMEEDFAKASSQLASIMRSWHMTHNLIAGVPVEALMKRKEIETANPNIVIGLIGPPKIREIMGELSEQDRIKLIGPAARNKDYQHLQLEEVKDAVDAIMTAVASKDVHPGEIAPVSPEKLTFNSLSTSSQQILRQGRINASHIARYFGDHPDPMRGEAVADVFRIKYTDLKAQALPPDTILAELYVFVAGPGDVSIPRQVAANSLLSFLFESCDIFENAGSAEAAE